MAPRLGLAHVGEVVGSGGRQLSSAGVFVSSGGQVWREGVEHGVVQYHLELVVEFCIASNGGFTGGHLMV